MIRWRAIARRPASAPRPRLQEADLTPVLTAEQERALARRIARGDPEARDHLIRANLRLVATIARGFLRRGLSLEDLVAEGNLGLIHAAEGFDPEAGTRFCTYASYWIKHSIRRAWIHQGRFVRIPSHAVTLLAKWRRASADLAGALGRDPGPEEVGRALGLTPRRVRAVAETLRAEQLAAAPEYPGGGDSAIDLATYAGPWPTAEEALAAAEDSSRVAAGVGRLGDREAAVVRLRFGLGAGPPLTQREVGERLGLTRERVGRLEGRALAALAIEFATE